MPAKTGHHAVGRPLVLDLQHGPLGGEISQVTGFGHHAVEAGTLETREPVAGHVGILRGRGEVHGGPGRLEYLLELTPPLGIGHLTQVTIAHRQHIEGHERGRRGLGQHLDPRLGRVDTVRQGVEVQPPGSGQDDLAVEHAAVW